MIACSSCGQENPDGFQFCGRCGSPLAPTAPQGEERKIVSVLFCDLVGFTARSDRADPEDVRATLRPYHAMLRTEIERYGGTVEKFIGDAVMAVFGAPVAHEDDSERAVRSGLRILDSIRELNQAHSELDLSVRIGINTGEAVVALGARPEQGEGIATGDVVNTAARIQSSAPVGAVVAGEMTYRSTRDLFDYEPLEAIRAKGKQEPVPVWRALRAKSRYGVDIEQGTRARLVGRDAELGLLQDTFTRTIRDSAPQLVTLTGEPGVGKSRLVWEFRRFVDDRSELVYWRQGRCLPYGDGIAFWALGEIIKAQAGINESDEPEEASAKLESAVHALTEAPEEAEWLKTRLAPLVGGETGAADSAAKEESFAAWRRFLELVASRNPLIAVFEDLHWADPAVIEFLEHLVDWASGVPMLVLCTGRPELYEKHPGWGGGKRNSFTVALSPLGAEDTARLISELLAQTVLPADVQATLVERSGGNPLYTEEFVKMLVDRGVLSRADGDGTWHIAADADIPLPESLQALIAARLDTLPPERKTMLQDGAVVGKVFWSGAVAAMGELADREAREGLHELARKEFLRPARTSSMENVAEYSFWHVLIRDVAYGQIPRAARGRKHRAAAEWIERMAGDRVVDHADFLAHHYGQALELAQAAGETEAAESLQEPLRRFLVLAGDRAHSLDISKAEYFYRRAMGLLSKDDPERARIALRALQAGWISGAAAWGDVLREYEEALDILRRAGDMEAVAEGLIEMNDPLWVSGDTARASRTLREAVEMLEGRPRGPLLVRAYSKQAGRLMLEGHLTECFELANRALGLAKEFNLPEVTARSLQLTGTYRGYSAGDTAAALEDFREAVRLAEEIGWGYGANTARVNLAGFLHDVEGPRAALDMYHEAIRLGNARGIRGASMWASAETTWTLYDLGDWDECLRVCDGIIEAERPLGLGQIAAIAMGSKARVLVARGHLREAAALRDEVLPLAREMQDPQVLHPVLLVSAELDGLLGTASGAVDSLAALHEEGLSPNWLAAMCAESVRCLVGLGRVEEAEAYLKAARPQTSRTRYSAMTARAILAEAGQRTEEALGLYADAVAGWRQHENPYEEAQALLGQARCGVALGRPSEAAEPVGRAEALLSRLGAMPLLAEASRLLEATGAAG